MACSAKFEFDHSNHDIIKRTEVRRQENERAIQKLLDKDIESKKDDWEKILGLKFSVRFFYMLSWMRFVYINLGHFQELLVKLRGGQITAVDALHAFQYRVGHFEMGESLV